MMQKGRLNQNPEMTEYWWNKSAHPQDSEDLSNGGIYEVKIEPRKGWAILGYVWSHTWASGQWDKISYGNLAYGTELTEHFWVRGTHLEVPEYSDHCCMRGTHQEDTEEPEFWRLEALQNNIQGKLITCLWGMHATGHSWPWAMLCEGRLRTEPSEGWALSG